MSESTYATLVEKRRELAEKQQARQNESRPLRYLSVIAVIDLLSLVAGGIGLGIYSNFPLINGIATALTVISIFGGLVLIAFCIAFSSALWPSFLATWSLGEEIKRLRGAIKLLEETIAQQPPTFEGYRERLFSTITRYQHEANGYRRSHYTLQVIIIICSLLVSGITSGLLTIIGVEEYRWIAPALSLLVTFFTALVTLFRFHDRGYNLQETADSIKYEISCANLGIYEYAGLSEEDQFRQLAERSERFQNEQRKRQQQLEQSSNTKRPEQ